MSIFNDLVNDLKSIEYFENTNLEKYTTIKLKAFGDIAIVKNLIDLQELVKRLNLSKYKYHMIGWGANQVIHNTDSVLFIKLDFNFERNYLDQIRDKYILPASIPLNILTSHAQKFGLKGWEVFTGIPASLGGAVFMNAGTALGEIGDLIESVKILTKKGELIDKKISKGDFSYRKNNFIKDGEIIVEVTMVHNGVDTSIKEKIREYLEFRKSTQPLATRNCGCVFQNFDSKHKAGHYIDLVGLKSIELNGLQVSSKHANFIENSEQGSSEDFIKLVETIQFELELFTGIKFELEAKIY
jgi:UDP-N-acetylmuramate dehydrogenase